MCRAQNRAAGCLADTPNRKPERAHTRFKAVLAFEVELSMASLPEKTSQVNGLRQDLPGFGNREGLCYFVNNSSNLFLNCVSVMNPLSRVMGPSELPARFPSLPTKYVSGTPLARKR